MPSSQQVPTEAVEDRLVELAAEGMALPHALAEWSLEGQELLRRDARNAVAEVYPAILADLREKLKAGLLEDERGRFEGPIGELIEDASGMASLEFTSISDLVEGLVAWLESIGIGEDS